jgi:formylglycine-generating enzyme required for sulfatase activity
MVYVAGGVFEMGCKSGRDSTCGSNGETPVHWVRVNNFYIGKYEVTQGLWKKVMGDLPANLKSNSNYLGDDKPVIYVSYNNITGLDGFLEKLNALTGKNYRLPTEAEWEYAARGCSGGVCENFQYSGSNTFEDVAYYNPTDGPTTVGTKRANALGIYDMSGSVYERCNDWYSTSYYPSGTTQTSPQDNPTGPSSTSDLAVRGGSWLHCNVNCRAAFRGYDPPIHTSNNTGFRVALPAY